MAALSRTSSSAQSGAVTECDSALGPACPCWKALLGHSICCSLHVQIGLLPRQVDSLPVICSGIKSGRRGEINVIKLQMLGVRL